ncbi:hypothetical protein ASG49_18065 [Marmoricola sp. Leaf446]|nr:hypothetical protein ASG49_18065 [Marmoricola sp. Leaf446]
METSPRVELPERPGNLVIGTHRAEPRPDLGGTWFEHVRDSYLFVQLLLMALALLLVLGALSPGSGLHRCGRCT